MYRSNEEKLADIMLGEAVLKLLNDGGAISFSSLTEQLTEMAAREKDPARHRACLRAMNDVRSSRARTVASGASGGTVVTQLFAGRGPADHSEKH